MLIDLTIEQYSELLSSHSPTPGGGSALANVALNAVSLLQMACNVTINKLERLGKQADVALFELVNQLETHHKKAMSLIDLDAKCFDNILSAMRIPKTDDTRHITLQQAYIDSANTCIGLVQTCVDCYQLADQIIPLSDMYVVSDAHIGRQLLQCVAQCTQHNVLVNTKYITNKELANTLDNQLANLLSQL